PRLGAAERAQLDSSRGLPRYLEVLRGAGWLRLPESAAAQDVDSFESRLRELWRAECRAVAGWHPPRWRGAFEWFQTLADLALLEGLRAAAAVPRAQLVDGPLAAIAAADPRERAALLVASGYAPLRSAWQSGAPLLPAWHREWRARWPPGEGRARRALLALEALVRSVAGTDHPTIESRAVLSAGFERLFRRSSGTGAAGFCELARRALEFEMLRGGFVVRLWVPGSPSAEPVG
ncbi:MAG TPA: hypothetical protein VN787_00810, partial [Steroidobacteraceae bacterium]|nr:hypothetical protein [Steroidobacteraceae bacterium]